MHRPIELRTFTIVSIFAFASLLASAAVADPILGNYPDTPLPLSTNTTVTPDATPVGIASMNVSTSADFKGLLAADRRSGAVQITNAHPAGSYNVTVTGFGRGGATATKTFSLTVTTPETCLPVSFAGAINYKFGRYPESIAVGDFNGDANQDLAVVDIDEHALGVAIFFSDGAGNFTPRPGLLLPGSHTAIAVGDFDGDGRQDIAVTDIFGDTVSIFLNRHGGFGPPTAFDRGSGNAESVAVGDFNGDSKQDLAVGLSGRVSILLGNGTGQFGPPTLFSAGIANVTIVALGDFNGDGKQDLAATSHGPDGIAILLGDGTGNFSAPTIFPAGDFPNSVAVGDFNGDGKQDLAVGESIGDAAAILLGDGAGNFSPPTDFSAGGPRHVAVGDFNGDGDQDLAVANLGSDTVSILLGDGTGNFSAPQNLSAGDQPNFVAVGDFNGDGLQDLAVANGSSKTVSIFLRECSMR